MNYQARLPESMLAAIHADLSRPHAHAWERVGFLHCRIGAAPGRCLLLAQTYLPVADADYIESDSMGAVLGPTAFRLALQMAYQRQGPVFHLHRHDHRGIPSFSQVDLRESAKFMPDFWKVAPTQPHGTLLLSLDAVAGRIWCPQDRAVHPLTDIVSIGTAVLRLGGHHA